MKSPKTMTKKKIDEAFRAGETIIMRNLIFEFKEHKPLTEVWLVRNKLSNFQIGEVLYNGSVRYYVFKVTNYTKLTKHALLDLGEMIEMLQNQLRAKRND